MHAATAIPVTPSNAAPVTYIQAPGDAFTYLDFDYFLSVPAWEARTSARHEAFWSSSTQPYTYGQGRGTRTYVPSRFPSGMDRLRAAIAELAGREMELCFLNRYDDQFQHLGWHSDDAPEQDDEAPIIVQTFGAEREIWFREIAPGATVARQLLHNGSVLIMQPGMQQTHHHRIPKHHTHCGPRISLTWRALK